MGPLLGYINRMNAGNQPKLPVEDDERDRRTTNIFLAIFFIVITGAGLWLVNALVAQRDLDNCVAQGRRNCGQPIEVPAR
jgi:hypothetical protein